MTVVELALIGLAMIALIGLGIVTGATIMWRLVHATERPPLPSWVAILGLGSATIFVIVFFIAGQWLSAVSTGAFFYFLFGMSLYQGSRSRASGR